jgi:hypothetical protein
MSNDLKERRSGVSQGLTTGRTIERVIGGYQIIAGIAGVGMMVWLAVRSPASLPGGSLWIGALPFTVLTTAGWRLASGENAGYALSIVMQTMQIIFVSARGFVWRFSAGLYLSVWITDTRVNVFGGADETWFVGSGSTAQSPMLGVNLLAGVLATFLLGRVLFARKPIGR